MRQTGAFEKDANQIEKISGMTDAYPYCMHVRDLTQFVVPWHWHEELELGYIEYGVSVIRSLRAEYTVREGEGFFINTNVMDTKYNGAPGRPVREINHIFHPVFLSGHFHSRFETKYLHPILQNQQLDVHIIRPDSENGRQILDNLRALRALQAQPNTEFQTRSRLSDTWLLLLPEIRSRLPERSAAAVDKEDRIRTMLSYIHIHYAEKITVADIAKSAHISEREALRCFQGLLKTAPSDYLLAYRIDNARKRLLATSDSVTAIGYRVGFSDSAYFGRVFKRLCGMTPAQYRNSGAQSAPAPLVP